MYPTDALSTDDNLKFTEVQTTSTHFLALAYPVMYLLVVFH